MQQEFKKIRFFIAFIDFLPSFVLKFIRNVFKHVTSSSFSYLLSGEEIMICVIKTNIIDPSEKKQTGFLI